MKPNRICVAYCTVVAWYLTGFKLDFDTIIKFSKTPASRRSLRKSQNHFELDESSVLLIIRTARRMYFMTSQSSTTYPSSEGDTSGNQCSHRPQEGYQRDPVAEHDDFTPIPIHHAIWMPHQPMPSDIPRNHESHSVPSAPFGFAPPYASHAPSGYGPPFYPAHPWSPRTPIRYQRELQYTPTMRHYERSYNVIHSSPAISPHNDSPMPTFPLPLPPTPPPTPPPSLPTSPRQSHDDGDVELIETSSISPDDVLCGRGAGANTHPGNVKFRTLIADFQSQYLLNKPLLKTNIAKRIVAEITGNGGRFLKLSNNTSPSGKKNLWHNIGFKAAREKTCQALRERAASTFDIRDADSVASRPTCEEIEVNDDDVLLGRGGVTNFHPGNQKFRELVRRRQMEYMAAQKLKKAGIATSVMEEVFRSGGRFLMDKKGVWVEISHDKARAKTSQALRERGPELKTIVETVHEHVAKRQGEVE